MENQEELMPLKGVLPLLGKGLLHFQLYSGQFCHVWNYDLAIVFICGVRSI